MTLEVNEITVLMAINSIGIITLISGCLYLVVDAFLVGNKGNAGPGHYTRQ